MTRLRARAERLRPWAALAAAVLVMVWGTAHSLARAAPVAADWAGALWFVGAALALMAVGIASTAVCVLGGPRRR